MLFCPRQVTYLGTSVGRWHAKLKIGPLHLSLSHPLLQLDLVLAMLWCVSVHCRYLGTMTMNMQILMHLQIIIASLCRYSKSARFELS